ncbi:MAG: Rod shape-determining protein RodA [Firmicutes bacterium ADurb.Bin419]|nr:MAG: Rod shape-determining protein RodA [Firmicutes bacterium ADurb.Bin419]
MSEHNNDIQDFLQKACSQIRYKSIHSSVVNELTDHIEEQKNQYIKQGLNEDEATTKAVEQMGDPVVVGKQLDKAHRPRIELSILSLVAVLVLIGGIVQFLISGASSDIDTFSRFLIYAPIGLLAFIATYFFDYTLIGRYSKTVYFILFAATIIYFPFSPRLNGSYPHVYYYALLSIPIFAGIVYSFRNKGYMGIIACGLFYVGTAFICLIAPRTTAFILLSVSCTIILTIAIAKGYFGIRKEIGFALVYIPAIITFIVPILYLFMQSPQLRNRITVMLNPELDPTGSGYQHLLVKKIIEASKPFGEAVLGGEFANSPVNLVLPGWNTGFSLTYIVASLGYVAALVIVGIILTLIVRMFISASRQKNSFGYLLSSSACIAITIQFILYVIANFGVITVFSSISLPFISYGGKDFIVNMILAGLVLSVYRRSDIVNDKMQRITHTRRLFSFEDGKLIIDLGLNKRKKTVG